MPRPFLLDPAIPLHECEPWDTTHAVRAAVRARLDIAAFRLQMAQRFVTRADLIGMLVTVCAPTDPKALKVLVQRPHPALRPSHDASENPKLSMTVRLPSPVSLRLDVLVRILQREGVGSDRRRLLSSLIVRPLPRGHSPRRRRERGSSLRGSHDRASAAGAPPAAPVAALRPPGRCARRTGSAGWRPG
jgi:hypothetical protein